MSIEAWCELRDLVLGAMYTKTSAASPAMKERHPELVALIDDYLRTGKSAALDAAAGMVAGLYPGISPEAAASNPLLGLMKS